MWRALQDHGFDTVVIKTKTRQEVPMDIEYKTFTFNDSIHSVGIVTPPKQNESKLNQTR